MPPPRSCYLAKVYGRLICHRGKKRAMSAAEHHILYAAYDVLCLREPYHDYQPIEKNRWQKTSYLYCRIECLGFTVTLEPFPTEVA